MPKKQKTREHAKNNYDQKSVTQKMQQLPWGELKLMKNLVGAEAPAMFTLETSPYNMYGRHVASFLIFL